MKEYPNFYENLPEAQARLVRTIVLYDNIPCSVLAITDGYSDGIFRVWIDPIGQEWNDGLKQFRYSSQNYTPDNPVLQKVFDDLYLKYPDCGVKRKHINAPAFKRFRPFPLGMCHAGTRLFYVERQPTRPRMEQGLTKPGMFETLITAGSRADAPKALLSSVEIYSPSFKDCILGEHFTPQEVLSSLNNPRCMHDALAFHREFALVRGPIDMLFLAYRSDIIGMLVNNDYGVLKLGHEFKYCREVVAELGIFRNII